MSRTKAFRLLCLLSVAAGDLNVESLLSSGRRAQSLPEGFEINETLNGSIPITVIPSWDIFLGFSDRQKSISGRMSVNVVFTEEAEALVERPEQMVDVVNFGSGSGDINSLGKVKLWDPVAAQTALSVNKIYAGEFSQSLYPYDLACYPFDIKIMRFKIALQAPSSAFYRLALGCVGEDSTKLRVDPTGAVQECTWLVNKSLVNFKWENFTCTMENSATMLCAMKGTREWAALLKTYMWPSVIYGLMGFNAFALGVKLTMPRVATTMLALLSLTNLRNQVIGLLPVSQTTSWMEEYFLIAISFMFLNLLGHAASFHLDATERHHTQKIVNKFNLWGMLSIFICIVVGRLHVRQCPLMDPGVTVLMTVVAAVVTVSILLFLFWYHRAAFREVGRKITEQVESLAHLKDDDRV